MKLSQQCGDEPVKSGDGTVGYQAVIKTIHLHGSGKTTCTAWQQRPYDPSRRVDSGVTRGEGVETDRPQPEAEARAPQHHVDGGTPVPKSVSQYRTFRLRFIKQLRCQPWGSRRTPRCRSKSYTPTCKLLVLAKPVRATPQPNPGSKGLVTTIRVSVKGSPGLLPDYHTRMKPPLTRPKLMKRRL